MRPNFETIRPEPGASWAFLNRRLPGGIPFEWHQHHEYELTLTLNSRGHRYVGDDVDAYDHGDLVLIGPGIPHSWCSREGIGDEPHIALVVWFTSEWVAALLAQFPEMAPVEGVLARASQGLYFSDSTRKAVAPLIEAICDASLPRRLLLLLEILNLIAADQDATALANVPLTPDVELAADPRLIRVLNHLHAHFAHPVSAQAMADLACFSVSAFHRLFRRHTRMTMVEYLVRLRIGRACSLLIGTSKPIALIALDVGYTNLSLFNRQFQKAKNETPREFRRRHGMMQGRMAA